MMNQEIEKLKAEVEELKSWKAEKERQQLAYPLDQNSLDVINERKLLFSDRSESTITADKSIRISIDGQFYQINVL